VTAEELADQVLAAGRVLVCVGCGGVGKTTVAAALALEAARRGRRALVLTIDPARRLADALGVEALGNQPQALSRAALDALGVPPAGSLSALMLDMKRTFDELVERFAEGEDNRRRILANPIYRHVSEALAGSVEFAAMEKVYEVWESGRHDLVVVDTPPAQHALDFLDAPARLLEFLESRVVQMLIHPAFAAGRLGFRVFQHGTRRILQLIERVTGISFLEDVSEFLLAFEAMSSGFRQRAGRVRGLLLSPQSSFVLVTGPGRDSVRQAVEFRERLETFGVGLAGVLVNRIRTWPGPELPASLAPGAAPAPGDVEALAEQLAPVCPPEVAAADAARAAVEAARGYAALVRRDERATRELRRETLRAGGFWGRIPELPEDVHDLPGLARVAQALFGGEAPGVRST
jgi:anion-transporting  ArsA/GET3 family ATPase